MENIKVGIPIQKNWLLDRIKNLSESIDVKNWKDDPFTYFSDIKNQYKDGKPLTDEQQEKLNKLLEKKVDKDVVDAYREKCERENWTDEYRECNENDRCRMRLYAERRRELLRSKRSELLKSYLG